MRPDALLWMARGEGVLANFPSDLKGNGIVYIMVAQSSSITSRVTKIRGGARHTQTLMVITWGKTGGGARTTGDLVRHVVNHANTA